MARFRYYLDNTLLQNEPNGLDDNIEIVIKRDKELRGLFYNYMASLVFWGDGYNLIIAKLQSEGVCATVTFKLQEQCADYGPYEDLYDGLIYMDKCAFSDTECTVTCEILDANYSALLQQHKETDITLDKEITISGDAQDPISVTCKFHGTDTGTYDYPNRTAYPVKDALEYLTRYITDNSLTVNSTYLTAGNYQYYIAEVFFQNGAQAGDNVDFEFTNSYGQTILIPAQPILNPATPSISSVYAIREETSGSVSGQSYMDTYFIYADAFDCSGASSNVRFIVHGWTKGVQLVRVTVSGVTPTYNATITECQPFEYTGAYPFVLSSMNKILVDDTRPVITNFKSLLQTLTACFGVAYRFTNDGSGPVMQVEQINSFFDDSEAIKLINVNNIIRKPTKGMVVNRVKVGEDNSTEELMFRPETWANPFCLGEELDAIRTFKATGRWDTDPNQDKNLIIHVEPDGGNWQSVIHLEQIWDSSALVGRLRYWYNAPLVNINCLYKNEFLFSGDLKKDGLTYEKTGTDPNLVMQIEFEHPLTGAQAKALRDNPVNFINFDGETGWIDEVRYGIENKIGKFVLMSEL